MAENISELIRRKWQFLSFTLLTFFVTFTFLSAVGFVPEVEEETLERSNPQVLSEGGTLIGEVASTGVQEPIRIIIPAVGTDVNVENPESRDIQILDHALSRGVVHYPGTGTLSEDANIFLFGHSSFLPNVINKNFQAFNGLKNLKGGENVFVDSMDTRYVYRVTSVELSDADRVQVSFNTGERKLTLATCNSFGAVSERYVVEASFVGSYLLKS